MRITHVVSSQRKPDTFVLRDTLRYFIHHVLKIARTAADTLLGIRAVAQAETLCGIAGQHHQTAYAGGGGRLCIPMGFLV